MYQSRAFHEKKEKSIREIFEGWYKLERTPCRTSNELTWNYLKSWLESDIPQCCRVRQEGHYELKTSKLKKNNIKRNMIFAKGYLDKPKSFEENIL